MSDRGRTAAIGILVLLGCLAGRASRAGENVAPAEGHEAIASMLSALIQEQIQEKSIPSFAIALVDDQRVVWAQGFGFEDREGKTRASADTIYRVGSVSKLFTDIAVMQLVERGELDLDAPVTEYLPDFRPAGDADNPVTLRQLMSHRSGLVRESPVGNYFDPDEPTLRATVESLRSTRLVYPPASRTKYSNAGIAVVGYVLERRAGRPFEQAVRDAVLVPLRMDQSGFDLNDARRDRLADADMWTYDGRTFAAPTFKLGTAPAGNLYSSVLDLAKFVSAVFDDGRGAGGRLLGTETMRSMIRPQFAGEGATADFGIGFHLSRFDGHAMIGHGGAVYGFSTQLHALPEQKLGVIAVAAKDGANGLVHQIVDHALRLLLAKRAGAEPPRHPRPGPIDPGRAKRLDGLFVSSEGSSAELLERDGRLFLRNGSFRVELKRLENRLIVDDLMRYGATIETTGPDSLTIGTTTYARRERPRPAEIPERWRGLVGEYGWDHNTLFVFEREGRLHCLIEWFFEYPLEELDDDTFAFPDYGLYHGERLVFRRESGGAADAVTAAEVVFRRREIGIGQGETFRISPIKPIAEIRDIALEAEPPGEDGDFRRPELVELTGRDDSIKLDIRYASTNNFMGSRFYDRPRAFLQKPAAEALARAHRRLKEHGFGLLVHDAYRPWYVTKMFWEATPSDMKIFVADPQAGSRHNRGCAVDLTLFELDTGRPVDMGAGYDEFSARSFPDYPVAGSRARWQRELLRDAMEAEGFTIYQFEWWHFDYRDWKEYPILNSRFSEIAAP